MFMEALVKKGEIETNYRKAKKAQYITSIKKYSQRLHKVKKQDIKLWTV